MQGAGNNNQDTKPVLQNQNHDHHHRRPKPENLQQQQQQHNQQQQNLPQKCPRCDSLNTKFCYYNNYSLSQPRYFCKTCRRYWTQGGTLRNVPVGGGCRKGKRAKTAPAAATSTDAVRAQPQPQSLSQAQQPSNLSGKTHAHEEQESTSKFHVIRSNTYPTAATQQQEILSSNPIMASPPFYLGGGGGGGYFSSLAGIHQPALFSNSLNIGSELMGPSSSLSLLQQEFNVHSFGSSQQRPVFQLAVRDNKGADTIYRSDERSIDQSASSANSQQNWTRSFLVGNSKPSGDSSVNPSQWPDLSGGYGQNNPP